MVRKHSYASRSIPSAADDLAWELENLYGPAAGRVIRDYAREAMLRDRGMGEQMRDQLRAQSPEIRAAVMGNATEGLYRPDAPGAKLNGVFNGLGDFVNALRHRDRRLSKVQEVMNSYGSELGDQGGFLVPEELRSDMVLEAIEQAIVRPRAINVPMGTLRTGVPAMDAVTDATTIFGFNAVWNEEAVAATESTAAFQRIVLDAKKLLAYGTYPNEFAADAAAFDTYLRTVVPPAMAWWEDSKLVDGTGVGEPEGFINAACAIKVTRATASHVKLADLQGMVTRMWPRGFSRSVWTCSPDVLTELVNVFLNFGSATTGIASPPGLLMFEGGTWRLMGIPLYPTEHVPALGTLGDLALVDLGAYLLGTRELLTMDVSPHYKFNLDMSAVRIRSRVDGRMWPQSALTPANSSETVSPVVILN